MALESVTFDQTIPKVDSLWKNRFSDIIVRIESLHFASHWTQPGSAIQVTVRTCAPWQGGPLHIWLEDFMKDFYRCPLAKLPEEPPVKRRTAIERLLGESVL